jgi:hypothetical protein
MYTEACSCNHFCCVKAISTTYYECVFVALDSSMQCAYAICDLWPVQLYKIFPYYFINGTILLKILPNIKCVFWFSLQLVSETFLILRRTERDTIKVYQFSCKAPIILVIFQLNYFLTDFWKILKYWIYWNSLQWELGCSMWTDRQTDRQTFDKSKSCFCNFANTLSNVLLQ